MSIVLSIIGAFLAIFIIIVLHELGHFFVARWCGVKILRFSIGFGKPLYKYVAKDGTEYVLAMIPLGGYVKMLGEGNSSDVPRMEMHRSFDKKPLLARMAIVLAGPITNFLLAIVVFWGAYLVGVEHVKPIVGRVLPNSFAAKAGVRTGDYILAVGDKRTYNWQQVVMTLFLHIGDKRPLAMSVLPKGASAPVKRMFDLSTWTINKRKPEIFKSLGLFPFTFSVPPVIEQVVAGSPAAKAGLLPGDRIVALAGKPMTSWEQVVAAISHLPNRTTSVVVQRGAKRVVLKMTLGQQVRQGVAVGRMGIKVKFPVLPASMRYLEQYNVFTAWTPAAVKTWRLFKYNALILWKIVTGKLSFKVVGGPISIFQAAGMATQAGLQIYLSFIGFISLAIGFINLLPVPGLDGGHFFFQLVEALIRRPVPARIQQYGFALGMLLVLLVVANATVNDIYRLFG